MKNINLWKRIGEAVEHIGSGPAGFSQINIVYYIQQEEKMKIKILVILALALFCTAAHAAPDSLACRMIDWLDVEGTTLHYGSDGEGGYNYSGTCLWDMAMGDSFLVWLPGRDIYYLVNPFSQTEVETLTSFDFGPVNARGIDIRDSVWYIAGGGGVRPYLRHRFNEGKRRHRNSGGLLLLRCDSGLVSIHNKHGKLRPSLYQYSQSRIDFRCVDKRIFHGF